MIVVAGAIGSFLVFVGLVGSGWKVGSILRYGYFSLQSACATIPSVLGLTVLVLIFLQTCNAMSRVVIFPASRLSLSQSNTRPASNVAALASASKGTGREP